MSYEARILKKANFYLNKYRLHHKKYPNYTTYTKWINQGKFTHFPFRVNEVIQKGVTSNLVGGNRLPQITTSKKRRRANLAGVIAIKDVLVKLLGKEPQVDEMGILIALYALEHLKTTHVPTPIKPNKKPVPKKEAAKELSTKKLITEEVSTKQLITEEVSAEEVSGKQLITEEISGKEVSTKQLITEEISGKNTIEMPEINDDDDWEALC